jgi:hypothetical protein
MVGQKELTASAIESKVKCVTPSRCPPELVERL